MRQQPACRFQMALKADLHLAFRAQARGIYDRGADLLGSGAFSSGGFHMILSGAVASLAIDCLWERLDIPGLRCRLLTPLRDAWIGVMAEHALVMNHACGALVVGSVVTRIHPPIAAFFGVPAKRQLLQRAPAGEVQVGAGMIAGTDNEIDLFLFDVGFPSIEADLPATLEVFPSADQDVEIGVRYRVIERQAGLEVFDRCLRGKPVEGPDRK